MQGIGLARGVIYLNASAGAFPSGRLPPRPFVCTRLLFAAESNCQITVIDIRGRIKASKKLIDGSKIASAESACLDRQSHCNVDHLGRRFLVRTLTDRET
jgi:hypothetical protein